MIFEILLIIGGILFCLLGYILFATLLIEIDTRYNTCKFSIQPIFKLSWVRNEQLGYFEMNFLGIKKKLGWPNFQKKKKKVKTSKSKKIQFRFNQIFLILKSFKIKKWLITIDTGDMPLNGKLFPIAYLCKRITGKSFHINFVGKNELVVTVENNLFGILKAYVKSNLIK